MTRVSDPQPGDVVVNSYHTGIYIGNGQMIHASDYKTGVIISSVAAGMNNNYISCATNLLLQRTNVASRS